MMATAGSQQGTIGEEENEFIQNLFEFDDQRAEEFATHRTKMSVLWADGSTDDWEREIFSSRHSLYPVCRDTTDKVVGILDIKDYFALPERSAEAAMSQAVKEPYFVPDSIKADVLFKRMRRKNSHSRCFGRIWRRHGHSHAQRHPCAARRGPQRLRRNG